MKDYKLIIDSKTNIKPKNVLEIGSRDGNDANELRIFFGLAEENIWIVEPNPIQQEKIKNKYPNFNLIKKAIFNQSKELLFNAVTETSMVGISSLLERKDNIYEHINTKKILVKTILGADLLNLIGVDIDICKIDVEGATWEVLESFGSKIKQIKSMHIECEHKIIWENQKLYKDVKDILTKNNFIEVYFNYCNNTPIQSDSIWVQDAYVLKA